MAKQQQGRKATDDRDLDDIETEIDEALEDADEDELDERLDAATERADEGDPDGALIELDEEEDEPEAGSEEGNAKPRERKAGSGRS